jgi:hypothetical protein
MFIHYFKEGFLMLKKLLISSAILVVVGESSPLNATNSDSLLYRVGRHLAQRIKDTNPEDINATLDVITSSKEGEERVLPPVDSLAVVFRHLARDRKTHPHFGALVNWSYENIEKNAGSVAHYALATTVAKGSPMLNIGLENGHFVGYVDGYFKFQLDAIASCDEFIGSLTPSQYPDISVSQLLEFARAPFLKVALYKITPEQQKVLFPAISSEGNALWPRVADLSISNSDISLEMLQRLTDYRARGMKKLTFSDYRNGKNSSVTFQDLN